jgi:hypothetical protein
MKNTKRAIANLLFATAIVAPVAPVLAQDAPPAELVLIDLRPPEEKEGTALVELEGKCNQDVFRIADVATDPLKIDLLREDISRIQMIKPKTLTVLNWSIYYNRQVHGSSGNGVRSVGIGGYTIPTGKKKERRAGSRCTQRDSAGGWYEGSEIHSPYYPIVSEFTGTYGGRPVKARVVYSPSVKLTGKFAGAEDDTQALLEVVHQTSEQVIVALVQ